MRIRSSARQLARQGAAAVEFAVLLPFLCFLFVAAVDYARIFYYGITVQNCARNGAYYASNYPNSSYVYNNIYGYSSMDDAVFSDASNLSPTPTYTVGYGPSSTGPFTSSSPPAAGGGFVQVTVNWTFNSITNYPGVPSTVSISRTSVMEVAPVMPTFP